MEGYRMCQMILQRQKRDDPKADPENWRRICDGLAMAENTNLVGLGSLEDTPGLDHFKKEMGKGKSYRLDEVCALLQRYLEQC